MFRLESPVAEQEPPSTQEDDFRQRYFPQADWNDWRWQLKNRITTFDRLSTIIQLSAAEFSAFLVDNALPVAITPYYLSLIYKNPSSTLRKTVIPVFSENVASRGESCDPLHEEDDSPVPCIVHRYPDRVLFLTTSTCASYCRYCTRSRMVGKSSPINGHANSPQWLKAIDYIKSNPNIRDVLLSGGDPLTLPDDSIEWLLRQLRQISHVEIIRIGTKVPVVLPQRMDDRRLLNILHDYHPLFMSVHFTHPDELTPEVAVACARLADAGIPLGSQTVLLKDVNDDIVTMKGLMQGLLKIRVRPYYLYQCDPIYGSSHFRTGVDKGLEIIEGLRGFTTGYAIPTFVIDAPGGGGKIPLMPEYKVAHESDALVLRNYQKKIYRYPC